MAEAAAQFQKGLGQLALLPDTRERLRKELEFRSGLGAALLIVKGLFHFDEHRKRRIADQSLVVPGAPRWQRDHAIEQRASS